MPKNTNLMKNLKLLLLILLGIPSCSTDESMSDEYVNGTTAKEKMANSNRRTFTEAMEIAKKSISILQGNETCTRVGDSGRTLDLENGVKAIVNEQTRANSTGYVADTLLYIFNFKDNKGFSVVSAYRQTDGLMAVVETGNYDPTVPTGNPGLDEFMRLARNHVESESRKRLAGQTGTTRASSGPLMCKPVYDTIFYKKVEPRICVRWGQRGRMGQYFTNGISGCSITAAAQIMSYFKYPSSISLTYSGRDMNETTLDWDSMCEHTYTDVDVNRDQADCEIGRLARQLGELAKSKLLQNATSTQINDMRSAFAHLGYNVGGITDVAQINGVINDDDLYQFANLLSSNKLIYMRGTNAVGEGHAWVIDGCYYVKALHRIMATYDGVSWVVFQEVETCRTCLNHINWGWNGSGNGYFYGWVYNPNNSHSYDSGCSSPETPAYSYINDYRYFTVTH